MKKIIFSLIFFALSAQAEMVDTFQFHNDADRLRAVELAKSLRCPQCQNQNLVESNSPIAYDLRLKVYNMVNDGKSNDEIVRHMTDRFGNFVRYNPPFDWSTATLWLLPILLFAAAAIGIWQYSQGRSRHRVAPLSTQQQQQLASLLATKEEKK
ncbi:MAG: heme lyase NrfEFG subunit NrfF [[Pasteurella] mairii]|uniref:Formate-dependent nitrite reductase complex subunit n=1 Tax=[Pasteurella] mairii TaxID=757 RepID=A0A379B7V6_9PAST|nr:heme lyase NrfEFG subunit NrfF [[Pasteurella] mairii]SUB34745.1 cytochrome c nitrite reductase, accessory protein NrfF [[Pasteurella] mairii]